MQSLILRPYQAACLEATKSSREQGRGLLVMASGLGKTVVAALDAKDFLKTHPGRLLYLCHSRYILDHAEQEFKKVFDEGQYTFGANYKGDTEERTDFYFATLQTMYRRLRDYRPDDFVYIVFDEGHHAPAKTYRKVLSHFKPQYLLGLTATPIRLDGQDVEEQFGKALINLDLPSALAEGLLTKVDYRLMLDDISEEALNEIQQSKERYSIKDLNRRLFVPKRDEVIRDLIVDKLKEVENPKALVYCQTVQHAKRFADLLGGVVVHSRMSSTKSTNILEQFKAGEIPILTSVDMFNEGIDIPDANFIVFLRSTVSSRIFYQQLGRGLRLSPGKAKVLVLDFVGTCERLEMLESLRVAVKESATRHGKRSEAGTEISIGTTKFKERRVDILNVISRARNRRRLFTEEELRRNIEDIMAEIGHLPNSGEFPESATISPRVYAWRWGTLKAAYRALGFQEEYHLPRKYKYGELNEEELLGAMRDFYQENGRVPKQRDLNDRDFPYGANVYARVFGSLITAQKLAFPDYTPRKAVKPRFRSDDDEATKAKIVALIREKYEELGSAPRLGDLHLEERSDLPSSSGAGRLFGGWGNALLAAGLTERGGNGRGYSKEGALKILRDFKDSLPEGTKPSQNDYRKYCASVKSLTHPTPSICTLRKMFGSWENALAAAGMNCRTWRRSPDDIIMALSEFRDNLPSGVQPSVSEYAKYRNNTTSATPSLSAIMDAFGSWSNAIIAAGITPATNKRKL